MMKCKQLLKPLCFAAVLLVASTCYGQTVAVLVGSSGAFNSMAVAGAIKDPVTSAAAVCGATDGLGVAAPGGGFYHLWTATSSSHDAFGVDARSGPPSEFGNLWVLYDSYTNPQTVCAYLSVDSIVGLRLYFGTGAGGNGTLSLAALAFAAGTGACPAAVQFTPPTGANGQAPFLTDDPCGMPQAVYNLLFPTLPNPPVHFTAAMSDIRPEDGMFANNRALAPCAGGACNTDKSKNGLGYGPAPFGSAIDSSYTATSAQVVQFAISGNDPVAPNPAIAPAQVRRIGAYPIMWFYGLTPSGGAGCAGDFVHITPTNVPSHTIALIEEGLLTRTTDLDGGNPATNPAGCAMTVLHREATSGTFNTAEWQVVRASGVNASQEIGVNPAVAACYAPPGAAPVECGNPYYHTAADGSTRSRVIGTGEMVKVADGAEHISGGAVSAPNPFGYAFWTFSSYAAAAAQANLRYVQVDAVDPILTTYAGGAFPACAALPCKVPFTNLLNGGYRNWNIISMVEPVESGTPPAPEALADSIIIAGQDQADPTKGNITDFVPFGNSGGHILQVFRSHYNLAGLGAAKSPLGILVPDLNPVGGVPGNGTNPTPFGPFPAYYDNGGDMAGAVFYDQNDVDFLTDNGANLAGFLQ